MGKDVWRHSPAGRAVFEAADEYLGMPLSRLCFQGPQKALDDTVCAFLASFVTNIACLEMLRTDKKLAKRLGITQRPPDFVAGFSAGYIAALVATEVIDFTQGLEIAREEPRLMKEACQKKPGKMMALIRPRITEVKELCAEFRVEIGSDVSETLIVLSGSTDLIDGMVAVIRQRKLATRIRPVSTQGAFHSGLMGTAVKPFMDFLSPISFSDPNRQTKIVGSSNVQFITTGEKAKQELINQLHFPVLWAGAMAFLRSAGVDTFIEIGHGEALSKSLKVSRPKRRKRERLASFSEALAQHILHPRRGRTKKELGSIVRPRASF